MSRCRRQASDSSTDQLAPLGTPDVVLYDQNLGHQPPRDQARASASTRQHPLAGGMPGGACAAGKRSGAEDSATHLALRPLVLPCTSAQNLARAEWPFSGVSTKFSLNVPGLHLGGHSGTQEPRWRWSCFARHAPRRMSRTQRAYGGCAPHGRAPPLVEPSSPVRSSDSACRLPSRLNPSKKRKPPRRLDLICVPSAVRELFSQLRRTPRGARR